MILNTKLLPNLKKKKKMTKTKNLKTKKRKKEIMKKPKKKERKRKSKNITISGKNSERILNQESLKILQTETNQLNYPDGTLPEILKN